MTREEDLTFVEAELAKLDKDRQDIAAAYDVYQARVQAQIELVLKDAGVWDVVAALEKSRQDRKVRDQEQVHKLEAEMADHRKVREFLRSRETSAKPVVPVPSPKVEEPTLLTPPSVAAPVAPVAPLPKPKYVNGIDVSRLDPDTKGLVMSGNPATLEALRRRPDLVEPPLSVKGNKSSKPSR